MIFIENKVLSNELLSLSLFEDSNCQIHRLLFARFKKIFSLGGFAFRNGRCLFPNGRCFFPMADSYFLMADHFLSMADLISKMADLQFFCLSFTLQNGRLSF